jgi:signal transduction histidine kinase
VYRALPLSSSEKLNMSEKKRVLLLVLIMAVACLAVTATTIAVLYRTTFEEQRDLLVAIARNHARLLEQIARFDAAHNRDYPGGTANAALDQIIEAHRQFSGIGHTGEFTLGRREGNNIIILVSDRNRNSIPVKPIPMRSKLAEPMRRALLGQSGSLVGLDYRGVTVLAAYEPVAVLNWGIVAKVDLTELQFPFARAGMLAMAIATIVVLVGTLFFIRITNPIIKQLQEHSQYLAKLVASLQQSEESLRKARDELEARVEERTANLVQANNQLEVEAKVRARAEERLRALWAIAKMVNAEAEELCDHVLQGTLQMTKSKYAFYGFLNPDESLMTIYSWSKDALEDCQISQKSIEYPVAGAGIWAEAIRQRRVFVVNDYQAEIPGKKGIPGGHVRLTRILAVPVFGHGRIVAVVVAANKDTDYNDEDVKQLEAFAGGVQLIIDQRKMESALRSSEKECRLLSRQVIEAQEKERKHVAREIHDGIGQSLAALKYRAESYARMADNSSDAQTQELKSFIQMIRDAMDEVRKIQNDLRPAYLDMIGVLETMADFCEKFQTTYQDIRTSLQIDLNEQDVPELLKTPLFRIFQEAMNNAAKHSSARQILVSIKLAEGMIELAIKDDGTGFEIKDGLSANGQGKALGLFSMKERAALSGGSLELRAAPGEGTTILAVWPIEQTPSA